MNLYTHIDTTHLACDLFGSRRLISRPDSDWDFSAFRVDGPLTTWGRSRWSEEDLVPGFRAVVRCLLTQLRELESTLTEVSVKFELFDAANTVVDGHGSLRDVGKGPVVHHPIIEFTAFSAYGRHVKGSALYCGSAVGRANMLAYSQAAHMMAHSPTMFHSLFTKRAADVSSADRYRRVGVPTLHALTSAAFAAGCDGLGPAPSGLELATIINSALAIDDFAHALPWESRVTFTSLATGRADLGLLFQERGSLHSALATAELAYLRALAT